MMLQCLSFQALASHLGECNCMSAIAKPVIDNSQDPVGSLPFEPANSSSQGRSVSMHL